MQTIKRGYLKQGRRVLRVAPVPVTERFETRRKGLFGTQRVRIPIDGDAQYPVLADRETYDADAIIEVAAFEGGTVLARFVQAQRQLRLDESGEFSTILAGTAGHNEVFIGAIQPDGRVLIWSATHGPIVVVEFVEVP